MEQYYEQNVVNKNIDERIKKTRTLTIAKTFCTVAAIGILLTSILFVVDDSFVAWLGILSVTSVPFIIAAVIIGRINKRNNTEYDYVIDDEYLKVSEIYFRERRKLKHSVRLRSVESAGMFGSEGYKKIESKAEKKILALVNYDNEKTILYLLYSTEKGRRIMFLEPDRGFMIALRRVVSAVNIFDKSMTELEKNLETEE
ncbi:MAG: hypothetical protein HFJ21_06850 [Clostridia bacterium]|jgi:hypothetical protein|nr:hypothetical protein [Clostridia bacterium]MCI9460146.1 hypothetical protein [Clostridia bacterium]